MSAMSDTQLSERLEELREMVKLISQQLHDASMNIDAILV